MKFFTMMCLKGCLPTGAFATRSQSMLRDDDEDEPVSSPSSSLAGAASA